MLKVGGTAEGNNAAKKMALSRCKQGRDYLPHKDASIIWTGGVGRTKAEAAEKALATCNVKGEQAGIAEKDPCLIWVEPFCAIDDRF